MPQDKPDKKPKSAVTLRVENSMASMGPGVAGITSPNSVLGDTYTYVSGKRYYPFLGSLDNLPTLLLDARLSSITQNSCVSAIAESVVGKGLKVSNVEAPDAELLKWFKCVNNERHSINEILTGAVDGERGAGNIFIEIKKANVAGKQFLKVYLHPIIHARLKDNGDGTPPTHVILSRQFAKVGLTYLRNPVEIPLWSDNVLDKEKCWSTNLDGTQSTMLHFKNEVGGVEHYGLPDSVSSYKYQLEEAKLVQYNIDNLENNMVLGGMLILKSAMTREEAEEQAKEIMFTHIGEGKTGRIAVVSSEFGLDDVKFEQFNTQKEGSFKDREATLERKIIMANRYHPALLGIESDKAMGRGSSFIRGIYDSVEAQLLNPLRVKTINKIMVPLIEIYADVFNKKDILNYEFGFIRSMPYSMTADVDPSLYTKVGEARDNAGLSVDDSTKDKYLCEQKGGSTDVSTKPATP